MMINISEEDKNKLELYLSKSKNTEDEISFMINFIKEHISPTFKRGCSCKGGNTKMKKIIKSRWDDVVVLNGDEAHCSVCNEVFTKRSWNNKKCLDCK